MDEPEDSDYINQDSGYLILVDLTRKFSIEFNQNFSKK